MEFTCAFGGELGILISEQLVKASKRKMKMPPLHQRVGKRKELPRVRCGSRDEFNCMILRKNLISRKGRRNCGVSYETEPL
jgi:hypothetical protein